MYIDTDTKVMRDTNEEPARLDIKEYVKQICERADKARQEQTEMFEKAMGITHEPIQLTRVDPDQPHCLETLQAWKEENENILRESAAQLNQALINSKAETEAQMVEAMERAAQEAAEKVKQEYIDNGLYKQTGDTNYTAVVKSMYGDYTPRSEESKKDALRKLSRGLAEMGH